MHCQQMGRALRRKDYPALILDHVGNVLKHGLPDSDFNWSLEPRPVQQREALAWRRHSQPPMPGPMLRRSPASSCRLPFVRARVQREKEVDEDALRAELMEYTLDMDRAAGQHEGRSRRRRVARFAQRTSNTQQRFNKNLELMKRKGLL